MAGLTVHGSENATLELLDGSDWVKIPGMTNYSETGGEAPTREVVAWEGSAQRVGSPRPPTVEFGMTASPAHRTWGKLRTAYTSTTSLQFRMTTKEESVFGPSSSGVTARVAAGGAVTLAGDGADFSSAEYAPGMILKVGAVNYVIDSISSTGEVKVTDEDGTSATASAAAATYQVLIPSLRRSFTARVSIADRISLENEGNMEATVTLAPIGQLSAPVVV